MRKLWDYVRTGGAMSAFGHYVRLATDEERAGLDRSAERFPDSAHRWYRCGTRGCTEPVTHFVGYRYVTGRGGRISSNERRACTAHAEKFAKKHGLEMPDEPTERQTRTGYMAVSDAIEEMR